MDTKNSIGALYGVQIITYEKGIMVGKLAKVYFEKTTQRLTGLAFSTGRIRIG